MVSEKDVSQDRVMSYEEVSDGVIPGTVTTMVLVEGPVMVVKPVVDALESVTVVTTMLLNSPSPPVSPSLYMYQLVHKLSHNSIPPQENP